MRRPDPFVLRHRAHVNIVALCFGALGLMTLLDKRYAVFGSVILFVSFVTWAYLQGRTRPVIADYLEYLKAAAEKDPRASEWLADTDAEFLGIWGIKTLEGLSDG